MERLLRLGVIAFLAFTVSPTVFAQERENPLPADTAETTETDSEKPHIRLEYSGTLDMPDGIALSILHSLLSSVGFDRAVSLAMSNIKVDEATAISLVDYLLDLGSRLVSERVDSEKMIACSSEREARSIEETYQVYSLLDDVRISVYNKYFALAGSELDLEQYRLLRKWLDITKISSSYTQLDYDYLYQTRKSDTEGQDNIGQFCNYEVYYGENMR
jgi:hypothetical protein